MCRFRTFVIAACVFPLALGKGPNHTNVRQTQQAECKVSPFLSPLSLFPSPGLTQPGLQAICVCESEPKTVKDAKFVIVAETDWKPGKPNQAAPVEIQLRITNLSKSKTLFSTFDTFGLIMKTNNGKQIMPRGGRDVTFLARPILIAPAASFSLCRKAELHWDAKAKVCELYYWDGTGTVSVFGPLEPSRYTLAFWYAAAPSNNPKPNTKANEITSWNGEVVTGQVVVEVGNN
jgi:hypothetical protein